MNYWRLVTHHQDPAAALAEYQQRGIIALGWGAVGDLRAWHPGDPDTIRRAIQNIPGYVTSQSATSGGECLWYFYHEMHTGDLVVLSLGEHGGVQRDVAEVTEEYEWIPTPVFLGNNLSENDYHHIHRVQWRPDLDGREIWRSRRLDGNPRIALVRLI
jgi:predicted Mrr-cat superfamily restriction endonuclease